ncbi:hypothetical protein MXB_5435 [Myxobolus squamalis]|nr:hypothetical protein MXB_5435 [Myxobolus squamalis]
MAKSKNHTNHNQNKKHHRNWVDKLRHVGKQSTKGMCPKFLKNLKMARKGNRRVLEEMKKNQK